MTIGCSSNRPALLFARTGGRVRLWLSTASRRPCRRLWATRGLLGWVVVAGAAHPVWTAGHLWGVSCPPTMGTPRDRARTRARPQRRGAISCAPAMDGPALERWAGQAPAPCRGRALRGRGKDCVRAPVEGAAHTGGWVNPPVWVRPSWPCRTRASTEPAPCRMLLPTAACAAMRNRHAPCLRDISVDPRRATPHLGGTPDRGKAAPNLPPNAHRKEREQ